MDSLDRELARRRGQRRLDAMKRRTGRLRRRVVAAAVIGFAVLWTVVFVQMETGNDPALRTGTVRSAAKKKSGPAEEPETSEAPGVEAGQVEAERVEAEQVEAEQREAEARELEELEAVTTGQS